MEAGRELDALVAQRVMGIDVGDIYWDETHQEVMPKVPEYSTDIKEAWAVVEKLTYPFTMRRYPDGRYEVTVMMPEYHVTQDAETAPLAICLCTLDAVGYRFE